MVGRHRLAAHRNCLNTGFTSTELLLVSVVIVVMLAVITPGLLRSRQAAQRTQCINNLYQLGVAFSNYEQAMTCLPPGCVNETGPIYAEPVGYHLGWTYQLLPYLDQQNVYEALDSAEGAYGLNNATFATTAIPTLMCPSRDRALPVGMSSYAGCIGGTGQQIDTDGSGLLYLNSSVRDYDMVDGRAYTIVAGEVTPSAMFGNLGLTWISGTAATLRSSGVALNTTDDAHYEYHSADAGGFGSLHDGTAAFLMADGSARSMAVETDVEVLRKLGDRADGEMLPNEVDETMRRTQNQRRLSAARQGDSAP